MFLCVVTGFGYEVNATVCTPETSCSMCSMLLLIDLEAYFQRPVAQHTWPMKLSNIIYPQGHLFCVTPKATTYTYAGPAVRKSRYK